MATVCTLHKAGNLILLCCSISERTFSAPVHTSINLVTPFLGDVSVAFELQQDVTLRPDALQGETKRDTSSGFDVSSACFLS